MTPTEQDKELRDILSKVLLDGQNQIHDLKDGKATPEQITERMFASLDYWQPKLMQLIIADRKRVALEARIGAAEHILNTMVHEAGGYCDEIGPDAIPNYIAELKQELENDQL